MTQAFQPEIQCVGVLFRDGRYDEARAVLAKILAKAPGHATANNGMAFALYHLGNLEDAERHARLALQVEPKNPDHVHVLGGVLNDRAKYAEAVALLGPALRARPDDHETRRTLSSALWGERRFADGLDTLLPLLQGRPHPDVYAQAGSFLVMLGDATRAADLLTRALNHYPDHVHIARMLACAANYAPGPTGEEILAVHRRCGEIVERLLGPVRRDYPQSRDPDRPLRVGFLSGDFREHSVAYFLLPLLRTLDPAQFTLLAYSTHAIADAWTERVRALVKEYRIIAGMPERPAAELIAADRPDILIDLAGYTDTGKLPVFHYRPAPIQMTYLGYPFSTGLSAIGCRVVDSITDPPGSERFSTERLLRLDPCFLCYEPAADAPDVAPPPSERSGHVTFGSFNALNKMSPRVVRAWARLLERVPGSRLLLKSHVLSDPRVRESFAQRMAGLGVPGDRLELLEFSKTPAEHRSLYARVDIALDTFPYNGTATTCEALWMGVPVVSVRGGLHAGRVGASLLAAAGLPALIAESEDEYIRLAAELASDRARLTAMRRETREHLARSALLDAPAFGRRFGAMLRAAWRSFCGANA